MSVLPGTHIDLTYLNKRKPVHAQKKSLTQQKDHWTAVGTRYIFKVINGEFKAFRRIEVSMA